MKQEAVERRHRSGLPGFFGLSGPNKRVLTESLILLTWVSLAIKFLPFRLIVKAAKRGEAQPAVTPDAQTTVRRCRWAVEKWAGRLPWKTMCFQKGLALHMMLRRRGIASILHYGVTQNQERGLSAHVWVSESDAIIMGGETAADHSELARFPADEEWAQPRR